jgi:hypothetical protein
MSGIGRARFVRRQRTDSTKFRARASIELSGLARFSLLAAGALFVAVASCASPRKPEPLATPALALAVRHFAGPPLRGPVAPGAGADAIDAAPEHALLARCRFVYLDRVGGADLTNVLQSAKLVVADTGNQVLITRTGSDPRVLLASGDRARRFVDDLAAGRFDRSVPAGELAEALPEGTTLALSTREKEDAVATASSTPRTEERGARPVAVFVSRGVGSGAGALTVLLALEDASSAAWREPTGELPPPIDPALAASAQASVRRRGVLLEDAPVVGGAPLVLVMLPSDARPNVAPLALIIDVARPEHADAAFAAAVERCLSAVAIESSEAARRSGAFSREEAALCEMKCGLEALEIAAHHRPALGYLASTFSAPLAESLAYVADDRSLAQYLEFVMRLDGARALAPDENLGWRLESEAYRFLARASLVEEIPPELASLVARQAGEAGRYPDELEEAVDACRDRAALEARFTADNRRALEDSRPASRVRAYDWLAERGLAPEEYDPLAPESERRAALERAETESKPAPPAASVPNAPPVRRADGAQKP